jgi:hypothetical protein
MTERISKIAAAYEADTFARLLDDGYLEIRTGPPPPSIDQIDSGDLLATFHFSRPSAPPSKDGTLAFYQTDAEELAPGSGKAGHFRAYAADHRTAILDGEVGAEGPLVMSNPVIRAGGRVALRAAVLEIVRS